MVAPVCLTSPRPAHRLSNLPRDASEMISTEVCSTVARVFYSGISRFRHLDIFLSPRLPPLLLSPLPRIFIYSTVNRTHESLFIEVLKIRSAINGIEIGEIFVFIGGEVLKRNLILISDSFSFSLSLSLFKENLETDGINNFQLNATRRLISFKHFTRSSNE